jgi:hemoglobin-like flavoprotein
LQNVPQEHMVSTVKIAVTHVSTSCVTDRTDIVHMVVLRALMETVVNFQVF